MKPIRLVGWAICACLALAGCGDGKSDPKAEAPPALKVQSAADENVFEVDRPEQFALITSGQHMAARQLRVYFSRSHCHRSRYAIDSDRID